MPEPTAKANGSWFIKGVTDTSGMIIWIKQWRQAVIETGCPEDDVLGVIVPELGLRKRKNRWSYSIAKFESETRIDYAWRS